jgi:phosphoglycolate phosphatase
MKFIMKHLYIFVLFIATSAEALHFSLKKINFYDVSLPKVVIFDWDNTLTYSWPKLLKVMNRTLQFYRKPHVSMEQLLSFHSIPQKKIIEKIFGEEREDVINKYWQYYTQEFGNSIQLTESTREILKNLKDNGVFVAILSNQNGEQLRKHVREAKLEPFVDIIIGDGDISDNKPHPDSVTYVINSFSKKIDKNPKNIWLVGDSITDMETARNAGILGVFVSQYATQDIKPYISEKAPNLLLMVYSIKELSHFYSSLLKREKLKINGGVFHGHQKNILT